MVAVEEVEEDESSGLINLDMQQFGSGTLSDPLRHAVGMRSAQDACKMRMWNSFPTLFQNTIFHGEQDSTIQTLRHHGTVAERLEMAKDLKEAGNAVLKANSGAAKQQPKSEDAAAVRAQKLQQREEELAAMIRNKEVEIIARERELKELRQEVKELRSQLEAVKQGQASPQAVAEPEGVGGDPQDAKRKGLEAAITNYEKAAGLLRFVECTRPDWKNDDGSYKGIEDQHLRVDEQALQGDTEEAQGARELVASCYLNIALASQWLGNFEQMQRACDEVLDKVSPNSVKALYRRAQARIGPASARDEEIDAAMRDLQAAARLAPQDKEVRALLSKLRTEKKAKESGDRSRFAGLFDRGEVVTNNPQDEGDKPKKVDWDLRDPRVQQFLDIRPGPNDFK